MRKKSVNRPEAAEPDGDGALAAPAAPTESPTLPEEEAASPDGGGEELRLPIPHELSLLPLRDNVLFPAVVAPLTIASESSVRLIDDAALSNPRVIGVVTMRDPAIEQPEFENVYGVGVAAVIRMRMKMPNGIRLSVPGL